MSLDLPPPWSNLPLPICALPFPIIAFCAGLVKSSPRAAPSLMWEGLRGPRLGLAALTAQDRDPAGTGDPLRAQQLLGHRGRAEKGCESQPCCICGCWEMSPAQAWSHSGAWRTYPEGGAECPQVWWLWHKEILLCPVAWESRDGDQRTAKGSRV